MILIENKLSGESKKTCKVIVSGWRINPLRGVFILKAQCTEFLHNDVVMFYWDTSSLSVIVAFGRQLPTRSNKIGKPISDVVSPIDEFRLLLTEANSSFVFRLTICKVHSGYNANSQIIPHFNKMTLWWSKKPAWGTKESNGAWMPSQKERYAVFHVSLFSTSYLSDWRALLHTTETGCGQWPSPK